MSSVSIYLHFPFCSHRCGYCDFNTYAGIESLIPTYTQAICREIEILSAGLNDNIFISTIYFGGGTPSLLPISDLDKILMTINNHFNLLHSVEISLEANPGTVTKDYLDQLHSLGVNRLSLGMQSADHEELLLLDRNHTFLDVIKAVEWSREVGFNNLNLDLIFGLPNQRMKTWIINLESALAFQPEHFSLYSLTLEEATPMDRKIKAGQLPEPDQDLVADMYEWAGDRLAEAGYHQYEISNWARIDLSGRACACRHNLQYWRLLPYLGVGAGAHGFIDHQHTENVSKPAEYLDRLIKNAVTYADKNDFPRTPATKKIDILDLDTEIGETMMMGLRLVNEGISNYDFFQRFGVTLQERFALQIDRLISVGLLEWVDGEGEVLHLTNRGRLLGNQVFREFI